jgi:hypothetical protein
MGMEIATTGNNEGPSKTAPSTASGPTPNSVSPDIERLKSEIEHLKQENQGVSGWIKKWGGILGLLAGLITIPKTGVELYRIVITKPHSSAVRGAEINADYDPKAERIRLSFNFSVLNAGNADDTIRELWGTLTPPGYSLPLVSFDSSKFHITEKNQNIDLPFSIAKSTSRDFHCELESSLAPTTIGRVSGEWMVDITITGQDHAPMKISYGLPITSDDLDEMNRSEVKLQFLNPH